MIQTAADGLLADILEHPGNDAPRLIFADWLEDNGQPERAEFIRVQLQLAAIPGLGDPNEAEHLIAMGENAEYRRLWVRSWELCHHAFGSESTLQDELGYRAGPVQGRWHSQDVPGFYLRRGFVESLVCTWGWWKWHHAEILQAQPIQRVYLKSLPRVVSTSFTDGSVRFFFPLDGECTVTIHPEPGIDLTNQAAQQFLAKDWPRLQFAFSPTS